MLLGLGGTYALIATLLVAFALRAKDLAVSDGLRFHEDLEQMRAMRPRNSGGPVRGLCDRVRRR